MLRMQKCLLAWTCVLLRLVNLSLRCDARAVNVSNTWTMPQEDLNVFYRFFRDRISWFEADAVCQFHHANLVTVDNSFQFDATRDLLRELDVNDIVWIGLLRPQNSDRFMWSNSRPLITNTGYWAEALPLMDAPLCAVIDPIRDYRWHALRCGGPETASFLCEMPVPAWADVCLIKDMPNLTMQYMADTASIELIRNCQEEGLLRQTCKGKEDRERAMVELICPKERLEAQRVTDMTNSHFKSLHIINSISTDNNEKNEIEVMPVLPHYGVVDGVVVDGSKRDRVALHGQQQENTVQHLIEQFSVDDMMQADEPAPGCGYEGTAAQPKPAKKNAKKLLSGKDRKEQRQLEREQRRQEEQQRKAKDKLTKDENEEEEEMMMGDQPMTEEALQLEHVPNEQPPVGKGNDDEAAANNEIFELLPHRKRILTQDLKPLMGRKIDETKNEMSTQSMLSSDTATATTTKAVLTTPSNAERTTTTTPNFARIAATTENGLKPTTTTTTTKTQLTKESAAKTTLTRDMINTGADTDIDTDAETISTTTTTASATTSSLKNVNNALATAHHDIRSSVTVGHAIHSASSRDDSKHGKQQQRQQGVHSKETTDTSHFIPPMLLVKSHYVPMAKHEKDHEHNIGPEFNDRNKQQHHHSGQLGQHRRNNQHHEQQHKGSAGDAMLTTLTPTTLRTNVAHTTTKTTAATTATTATLAITNTEQANTATMPAQTTTTIAATKLTKAGAGVDADDDFTPAFNAETEPTLNVGRLTTVGERLVTESVAFADRQAEAAKPIATTTAIPTTTTTANVKTFVEQKNEAATKTTTTATTTAKLTNQNVAAATAKLPTTIASQMNEQQVEQIKMAAHEATNPETLVDMVPTATATTTTTAATTTTTAAAAATTTPFGAIATQKQAINELKTNRTATTTTTARTTTTTERETEAETETETSSVELKKFTLASNAREKGTEANAEMEKGRQKKKTAAIKKTEPTKTATLAATSAITATISTTETAFPATTTTTTTITASTSTPTPTPATTATTATNRNFFLDAATEAQYKPNRRRSLTKPETQSYFKKILG